MALSELLQRNLPTQPMRQRLHAIGGRVIKYAQERISRHGVIGEIFVLMVVFSGLRLLWASAFPVGWWVMMGLVFSYVATNEKFIWPKEKERMAHEMKIREMEIRALELQRKHDEDTPTQT